MKNQHVRARAIDWLDLSAWLDPCDLDMPPPERDAEDWRRLYGVATAHLVAPSLYATLAARDRLDGLPEEIREALALLHQLNAAHNNRLRALLHETTERLNAVGIQPIALKGAIALLSDPDSLDAARMLGDLDLWVGATDLPAAADALRAGGYHLPVNIHPSAWSWTDKHHAPPLMHPSGSGYVELHRRVFNARVPSEVITTERLLCAAQGLEWRGVRLRIPSLEHRLIHNALHHQVSDQAFASDRRSLRQLFEFARLRALPEAASLDWARLLRDLDHVGMGEAMRLNLLATRTLFGQALPPGVRATPKALAAEGRFWWRLEHPALDRWLARHWHWHVQAERLRRLPRRLVTPAWYSLKYHQLKRGWFTKSAD
ncbi:hypothetical protein CKO25_17250 [Thiocapsa imhoffii]|uniref:Nucleotidyltransferase family protein n=1 Tax=Thiocapsa imhoffii TaxID=382777 RepID=A0A9X0WL27_9GAMM|nr:nucleotidyltransferase family protein [Thiocapsa imhoffii]MBK1646359.1 hypothetical protein [Thiocapsa imhoffii]